jgi:hypothetical protein
VIDEPQEHPDDAVAAVIEVLADAAPMMAADARVSYAKEIVRRVSLYNLADRP